MVYDQCHAISRTQTIAEPWMILASFAAFLPQFISFKRNGALGISPGWILSFVLFSTTQLALQALNLAIIESVECVQTGKLRGWKAFGALLGNVQVGAQWVFSLILFFMYLIYRIDTTDGELDPILGTTSSAPSSTLSQPGHSFSHRYLIASNISSFRLLQIAITYAVVVLTAALLILLIPAGKEFDSKVLKLFIYLGFYWVEIALNIIFVILVSAQQVRDIIFARERQGLSTRFLSSQCLNLAAVGLLQFTRPGNPVSGLSRKRYLGWFVARGSVPILYFVLAVVFAFSWGLKEIRSRQRSVENPEAGREIGV